ncbi:mediator of RNA polymerase II transcription subunit 7-like [Pollicipes pollicipes]|uniref:mediator of RNA polymerase II transcription subunit 7-like n=1 Tax=Pollicipes pollicipes TaxID=41117 RepID=UPI001885303D|nr:mediator of RNA polymerase II transcription subunit 7-like [Pollicipes pollicipes]XP_037087062.1 mediator of RNA polymerase II transcription subunit 7-like [Pollicipes pollicipes]
MSVPGGAMATGGDAGVSSSLPLPSIKTYGLYTDDSYRRGLAPPPPPVPPTHDTYSMFGSAFCMDDPIIQPLENQGIKRLYPLNFDHRKELKKLNHSVLANFLDLLEILIRCPDSSKRLEKIDDIKLLFIHMHHLINEFRPHQAREALRVTLELQKRQRLDIANRFQLHLDKVLDTVNGALQALPSGDEFDSKLLVPTEAAPRPSADAAAEPADELARLDAVMCQIMDAT